MKDFQLSKKKRIANEDAVNYPIPRYDFNGSVKLKQIDLQGLVILFVC